MIEFNYIVVPGLKYRNRFGDPNWRRAKIMAVICKFFEVEMNELTGRWRPRRLVIPRQIAMLMLHRHTMMNKTEIGKMFNRDHTSVIHSLRTIDDLAKFDEEYREKLSTVEGLILS